MTTALALTPDPSTGSVLLQVTGAPVLTALYTQGTGVDSFAVTAGTGTIAAGIAYTGAVGFLMTRTSGTAELVADRTVTGLTVGARYRVRAYVHAGTGSDRAKIGIGSIGATGYVTAPTSGWALVEYLFTATATSHTVQTYATSSVSGAQAKVYYDDITVAAVSAGYATTAITRVDANGAHPVRLLVAQEPISGSMTVTDYEPALSGTVRYDLVDAAGVLTTASTALTGVSLPVLHAVTFPSLRASLAAVTGYTGRRATTGNLLKVIGRPDPFLVGGALATREGTLEVWCADYADALAVCDLALAGQTLMFRQVDYPGMDMWLAVTAAEAVPAPPPGVDGLRWTARLDYTEVACPPDALQGALGWTWASVSSSATTWSGVRSQFATWSDLLAGP